MRGLDLNQRPSGHEKVEEQFCIVVAFSTYWHIIFITQSLVSSIIPSLLSVFGPAPVVTKPQCSPRLTFRSWKSDVQLVLMVHAMRLTKRIVVQLSAIGANRDYFDDALRGLCVQIRKSGYKSYFVMTQIMVPAAALHNRRE